MDPKYLPSKQFIVRWAVVIVLLLGALGVYKIAVYLKNRSSAHTSGAVVIEPGIIQKDSNNNSIPDWEESLWGLDPATNGPANKEFIIAKRESLAKESATGIDTSQPLSDNENFSREFFSVVMSLRESGNLDDTALQSVGDTIGKKIIAVPLVDTYSKNMLLTIKTNPETLSGYTQEVAELMASYHNKDIGKELTYISVGLSHNDSQAFDEALRVASAYRSFAKELMKIRVPNTVSTTHLAIANDYEKVASTIEGMSSMLTDPFRSMQSIVSYKKYTDALVSDVETLSKSLE